MPQRSTNKGPRGTKALADVLDAVVKPRAKPRKKPAKKTARAKRADTVAYRMEQAALGAIGKRTGRTPKFRKEYLPKAEKLAALGATDQEIADFFDVDARTIYRWKHDHPAFCQALKLGKEIPDERVKRSLYQQAVGYEQDEVKIFMPADALSPVYAPFRAKVAPNPAAAIFWLKNRLPAEFRDKVEVEHQFSLADLVLQSGLSTAGPTLTSTILTGEASKVLEHQSDD